MRVLHLNLEKGWRGGERQTLLSLQGLQAAGHAVALAARTDAPLAQRARAAGISVFDCAGSAALVRLLLSQRRAYDIMHAQTAQAMSLLAVLRPVLSAALVFTRRTAFDKPGHAQRQRWKWSRADALVAISQAAAATPRALGLEVCVIPSAVQPWVADPDRTRALCMQLGLVSTDEAPSAGRTPAPLGRGPVLLTTAALSPEKDPLTLIRAVDHLRVDYPGLLCVHCGADGTATQAAHAEVQALGLQDHYRFQGFQAQVGDYLSLADVYVSSSLAEALGTSVLDACLAGVPVVATAVGGHPEILEPDRGLLVPAGDPQALARRIGWLLRHPDVARAMAQRAQAHVARVYSVPAMVDAYARLYAACCRRA
ncbi:glycosyltransferase family 4 protein [Castellaniella sp.]|uniref:glycosyltransferase family 4 protein n=1 Tax=Castellaniella sp. TaxID=1955812 RepID=UPI002AFF439E|nr:glycosyltransferase family 4 protein [Castellaniella sp.]